MTETQKKRIVQNNGENVREERIVIDEEERSRGQANKAASFVWTLFGILIGVISIRVLLKLIAANPENPFTNFIYNLSGAFLWPFVGITTSPGANGMVLDVPAIIGILVYALAGWAIVKLLWLIIYKPA